MNLEALELINQLTDSQIERTKLFLLKNPNSSKNTLKKNLLVSTLIISLIKNTSSSCDFTLYHSTIFYELLTDI